jgi:hypothetical protein
MKCALVLWGYLLMVLSSAALGQTGGGNPIITEFLPNQTGELETEWIELYNPTTSTINLNRYKIGDALGLREISDTGLPIYPKEYFILAQDVNRFRKYYTDFIGRAASPKGWQILNNSGGDIVRLADETETVVDSVFYDAGFPNNRSWERYIAPDGKSYWGGSFSPTGSTPGERNTYFYPRASSIELSISPDPFSPDGDGFEDVTTISINPPDAKELELVIYDISGRRVKTFFESDISIPAQIVWDGTGDDGRTLPVGPYIVYARVEGGVSMETKKTVVIAR